MYKKVFSEVKYRDNRVPVFHFFVILFLVDILQRLKTLLVRQV